MERRTYMKSAALGGIAAGLMPNLIWSQNEKTYPVTQITDGKEQHWFGYYDKWQIDPTGRYALGMQVDADLHQSPSPSDTLIIGLIDLEQNNKWIPIGKSSSWGWQQGCMLQWIPNSAEEVIWNARMEDGFVSIIHNIKTGQRRILPKPIYTLSPDGTFALGVDFARLQLYRPGYGYAATEVQPVEKAPDDKGIYKMDLATGTSELILSYADVAKLERPIGSVADYHHWINHLLINPSGTRFIFLNRSRFIAEDTQYSDDLRELAGNFRYTTRAITANIDGSDIYALNDSGQFSHFIWKGDDAICAWARPEDDDQRAFYLFQDKTKQYETVGEGIMKQNGHNTYVPNTNYEWILNDTYPNRKTREQELYLFHVPTQKKVSLGKFYSPDRFTKEVRCDLHPRCNQQGTTVFFDSTHNGNKRQIYSVDISNIVKNV